ncbi:unnamed protein product [Didymodactylos carnosus]|uniref:Uncharacterized protein n=1 Tax=Didymodactylos carnosus TaxID=1234261 RepID=A0A8S2YHW5_9BILA|nr:unnamed protein product [Didymodactylos carnosus]
MITKIEDKQLNESSDSSVDEDEEQQQKLQKPNIYNKYLPFYEEIKKQGFDSFNEICENLSKIIQLRELRPGFSLWSSKLQRYLLTLYN